MYFDTLNRVGVAHECDRQTDRRTDGHAEQPLAGARWNDVARRSRFTARELIAFMALRIGPSWLVNRIQSTRRAPSYIRVTVSVHFND